MNKYVAHLLFRIVPDTEDNEIMFFESIIVVEASSIDEAWERSERIGNERGRPYAATTHQFIEVTKMRQLKAIEDGYELTTVYLSFETEPRSHSFRHEHGYFYLCKDAS